MTMVRDMLTPTKKPYRSNRHGSIAAFLIGTGLGAIVFFGWLVVGSGLIVAGLWLLWSR